MKSYNIAIAGASGAVGKTMLSILEERNFPVKSIKLLSSARSAGKKINFKGKDITFEEMNENSFKNIDIALFSAGGSSSKKFAPIAVKEGCVVIDNSSAFRMDENVPLVVPEVNPEAALEHKGIIANPNCTTIIMIIALKPLHDYAKIKKVNVASYQSASGAGALAMEELEKQIKSYVNGGNIEVKHFAHQLLNNVIPHVDVFTENNYTKEEMKMFNETRKILGDNEIKISSTCVRVPVFTSHSEAVTITTENKITREKAIELLGNAPGVTVEDDTADNKYPMPLFTSGKDDCYVGRIREDIAEENGLTFWVSGDQLRKGAALNAIQIAELLIK